MYAAAHPGKLGDCLYVLPTLRYIYNQTHEMFDFYTSDYCEPLRRLFEYQPFINKFIVAENYKVERMDMGCQPWNIPIPNEYERVFQMGFKRIPDRPIHQFIGYEQGINVPLAIEYDFKDLGNPSDKPYMCIAPRGITSFLPLFTDITNKLLDKGFNVAVLGGHGDNMLGYTDGILDFTGADMLDTLSILHHSKAFIGLMSSQLVLANGIDIPRIAPHDGKSWDMTHVIQYHRNFYPVNPSADLVLRMTGV